MDYEQKYRNLVEAVKELQDANPSDDGIQKWVKDNVPELKESEDERIRKEIITYLKHRESCFPKPNVFSSWIYWLEKQAEQKPAAWSEEDENRFTNLISLVKCSKENDATKEGFIKFINRLKSIGHQSTWKPSEEQMDTLETAISSLQSTALESLYNELKKL